MQVEIIEVTVKYEIKYKDTDDRKYLVDRIKKDLPLGLMGAGANGSFSLKRLTNRK